MFTKRILRSTVLGPQAHVAVRPAQIPALDLFRETVLAGALGPL